MKYFHIRGSSFLHRFPYSISIVRLRSTSINYRTSFRIIKLTL